MTYQDIGHLFFPVYCAGCLLAMLVSSVRLRDFFLAASYGFLVIFLFQMRFDGEAHHLGWRWYVLVAGVQAGMSVLAWLIHARASLLIMLLAAGAILLNAVYLVAFLTHPLPRQGYFVGVNLCQSLQVGSLIFMAPLWPFLRNAWVRRFNKRRTPWMPRMSQHSQAISGPP